MQRPKHKIFLTIKIRLATSKKKTMQKISKNIKSDIINQ